MTPKITLHHLDFKCHHEFKILGECTIQASDIFKKKYDMILNVFLPVLCVYEPKYSQRTQKSV